MQKIKVAILVLTLLYPSIHLYAQKNNIRFTHITQEDGLSQNTVHCILKDRKGFMWFGTQDGLNRYDGRNIRIIKSVPNDTNTLSHSWVTSLLQDSSGSIWVGTLGGGLNKYDPKTETFTHYKHDRSNTHSLSNNQIWTLFEDTSAALWIGTLGGGLVKFNREDEVFTPYRNDPAGLNSLSHDRVRVIYEDSAGLLWVGTSGGGLNKFDPQKEIFTHYKHDPSNPRSLSHDHVWAVVEDDSGMLWVGTNGGGLNKFDPQREVFTHYGHDPDDPQSLSSDMILSMYCDKSGLLWIMTWGGGLNKLETKNETFTHYRHKPADRYSLNSDNLVSIYADDTGLFWVGTIDSGVSKFIKDNKFETTKSIAGNTNSLSTNNVRSFYQDDSGILWIGTYGGLNRYDPIKQKYTHFKHRPGDPNSLSHDVVTEMCEDIHGTLWIGTNKGLNRFDRERQVFKRYIHDPNNPNSLSNDLVGSLTLDKTGILWIGTGGGGLDRFDPLNETFTNYSHDPEDKNTLGGNTVLTLYEDKSGRFWIGTRSGGLSRFDRQSETFIHFKHDPKNPNSLSTNNVIAIHESKNDTMWIGTAGGGLNRFDREEEKFVSYTEKDGLPNNVVYGILEDENCNLWLSTNKGISKFNPASGAFNNYDVSDGLQGNEFNEDAFIRLKDGMMIFGGINGFNSFYPENIKENPHIPPVVLTNFRKFDKIQKFNSAFFEINEIELSYRDKFFSFEFASLDYFAPEKNQYMYKLEGFDSNWINSGTRRYASYTNLRGGNYVFRVKGSNNDGVWNEEGLSLNIKIHPPLWETWWFRIGALFAIMFLIVTAYKMKTRNIKKRNIELEKTVAKRTEVIEEQTRRLDESLRDTEEARDKVDAIIKSVADGLIVTDLQNRIILMNHSAEELLDVRLSEVIGRPVDFAIEDKTLREKVKYTLNKKKTGYQFDFKLQKEDTERARIMRARTSVMNDKKGKKTGIVMIIHDVTHEREVDRMKTEFLSTAAHELRTPLTSIQGFSEILRIRDDLSAEEKDRFLFYIHNKAENLTAIINDLLDVSRIESGRGFTLNKKKCNAVGVMKDVLPYFKEMSKKHKFKMSFPDKAVEVFMDKEKVKQALENILSNAVKYSPEGGNIRIVGKKFKDSFQVSVKDEGIGMTSAQVDKMFSKFYRVNASDSAPSGTGLGMTIVKSIVEAHKGKVRVESEPGQGTTVSFSIPFKSNTALNHKEEK